MIALDDIKPGMFGFSGNRQFIQRAISFFTGDEMSHSFTVIPGPCGETAAFETTSTIVSAQPMKRKVDEPDWVEIWEPIGVHHETKSEAMLSLYLEYASTWYSYWSYLWFMWRWLARKFGREPVWVWGWASNGVTCSELTSYYIMRLGGEFTTLFSDRDYSGVAPADLRSMVSGRADLFRFVGWLKPNA